MEATLELPRKKPHPKGPQAIPMRDYQTKQAVKKVRTFAKKVAFPTIASLGAALTPDQAAAPTPPAIIQEEEASAKSESTTFETVKPDYTDLLTKNPEEQAQARLLIDGVEGKGGARQFVIGIAVDHMTGGETTNLGVVKEYQEKIVDEAIKNDLPPQIALAVAWVENSGGTTEVSSKDAVGIFQLKEATATDMKLKVSKDSKGRVAADDDRLDPDKNIEAGVRYIALQRDRFGGNLGLALRAYNRGPQEVLREINADSMTRLGYPIVSSEASFDDSMTREILGNYIRMHQISAFSLDPTDPYVPQVAAATEHLIAEKITEPEKMFVTIPSPPLHAQKAPTDGAVV